MAAKKRKPTTKKVVAKKPAKKVATKAKTAAKKKPAAKKAAVKRPAVKKAAAKKAAAPQVARPSLPSKIDKAFTKGQLVSTLSARHDVKRNVVSEIMEDISSIIGLHMKKTGPRQFTLPGLCKITVKTKPATKARKGTNPFTGEEMMFKAKPARSVVKIRPLQKLKEMV